MWNFHKHLACKGEDGGGGINGKEPEEGEKGRVLTVARGGGAAEGGSRSGPGQGRSGGGRRRQTARRRRKACLGDLEEAAVAVERGAYTAAVVEMGSAWTAA